MMERENWLVQGVLPCMPCPLQINERRYNWKGRGGRENEPKRAFPCAVTFSLDHNPAGQELPVLIPYPVSRTAVFPNPGETVLETWLMPLFPRLWNGEGRCEHNPSSQDGANQATCSSGEEAREISCPMYFSRSVSLTILGNSCTWTAPYMG